MTFVHRYVCDVWIDGINQSIKSLRLSPSWQTYTEEISQICNLLQQSDPRYLTFDWWNSQNRLDVAKEKLFSFKLCVVCDKWLQAYYNDRIIWETIVNISFETRYTVANILQSFATCEWFIKRCIRYNICDRSNHAVA